MAIAAPTITREMLNHYITTVTGGVRPSDLYITPLARDFVETMTRTDTPGLDAIPKKAITVDDTKLVFGEGDIVPRSTTITEADDGSETVLDVADARIFQQWDLVRFEGASERMLVTDPPIITSSPAGQLIVSRRYGGVPSSAEAHNTGTTIIRMAPAVPEGVSTPDSPVAMGDVDNNWCQIIEKSFRITHRGRIVPDQEIKSDRARVLQKRMMNEVMLDLDELLFWGIPYQGDASGSNPMTTGGVLYFTSEHTSDLSDEPFDLVALLDLIEETAEDVGETAMGHELMSDFKTKRAFNSMFASRRQYQSRGDVKLMDDGFDSDFGKFKWRTNYRWKNDQRILLWNPEDAKRVFFEGGNWATGYYSTDGWFDHLFLRADLGFLWTGDRRRAMWTNYAAVNTTNYPNLDLV